MMNASEKGNPQVVWLNGEFLPLQKAAVSPLDRGFLYGDGLFETLRAEAGRPLFLADHLQRLTDSLAALRIDLPFDPDWKAITVGLLQHNGLAERTASLKIIVSRGIGRELGLPAPQQATVCAIAQPYSPPAAESYHQGWRLHLFREGFAPPLAQHKSLNYLYFLTARQAATDLGADEAVILDPGGKVSETSAGSLLACSRGRWWTPASSNRLPGITLHRVAKLLGDAGTPVTDREAKPEDLLGAETIWVLNSLIGIMPVRRVMDRAVADPAAPLAAQLRAALFDCGRSI